MSETLTTWADAVAATFPPMPAGLAERVTGILLPDEAPSTGHTESAA